jgi:tetratricopeptide (TPR) repeat protein
MDWLLVHHEGGARRWSAIAVRWLVAIALAAVILWWFAHMSRSACEEEFQRGHWERGVQICRQSYEQGRDAHDLLRAAKSSLQLLGDQDTPGTSLLFLVRDVNGFLHRQEPARGLARQLLEGPLYGDGQRILSYLALRRKSTGAAKLHAMIAYIVHTLVGDDPGRGSDAVSLAQAAWQVGDFTASLAAADEALQLSERLQDPVLEVAADRARADALRRVGDIDGAARALLRASDRATEPCDQAWLHLKSGLCQMEANQVGLAKLELDLATRANQRCGSRTVGPSIALTQAWLLRFEDPAGAAARLEEVTRSDGETMETQFLRGYLAADRGAFPEADGYLRRAAGLDAPDADWLWDIARSRAELAEVRGGVFADFVAELHYRRSIAMVAVLRATAHERAAYFVTSHRGPYDGLIALLARRGRWREALAVILELDASDMLRSTADGGSAGAHASLEGGASPPSSAAMSPATVEDVLAAWRGRDLEIVIAAAPRQIGSGHERAYRLRIAGGQVTGEDVGDAGTARKWADRLSAAPGDPERDDAARALGQMMVPTGTGDGPLYVLAIGALSKVPLAALRDADGALSSVRRPPVRVLGLRARGPESRGAGPERVIADPRGDLVSAMIEGWLVAQVVPGAQVSGARTAVPATCDRLWAAGDASLLHIAAHVGELGRWRALLLAGCEVDPAEVVRRRLAPRIAVLAACGSAAAQDEEGWGSIAAALLESGTAAVIATDRTVDDAASLEMMLDFYAERDWRTDPARALARVQQAHAPRSSHDDPTTRAWAAFSVLGRPPVVATASAGP